MQAFSSEKHMDEYILVNNCAEQHLFDRDYNTLRENGRVDFGLQYIAEGRCYYEDDGEVKVVEKGKALLHFPNVRQHYFFKKEDKTILLWVHFTGHLTKILDELKSDKTVIVDLKNERRFEEIFRRMISAQNVKAPYYEITASGYLMVLLSDIAKTKANETAIGHISSQKELKAVINDMHLNFNKPIDIKKYADMCCISLSRFAHVFKEYTGVSPYRFVLHIKIERAMELLMSTDISVEECAEAVGFSDPSYFSRIFKKMTSKTPTEYKKAYYPQGIRDKN